MLAPQKILENMLLPASQASDRLQLMTASLQSPPRLHLYRPNVPPSSAWAGVLDKADRIKSLQGILMR